MLACSHGSPESGCSECARAVAPVPSTPPLARVALVPPEDAATLAVLRAALAATPTARELLAELAAGYDYDARHHAERADAAAHGEHQRSHVRHAAEHAAIATVLRAVLTLHVPSVPHAENVPAAAPPKEAP